jgi:DNA-binding LacI/PurR family transcriptional regulator
MDERQINHDANPLDADEMNEMLKTLEPDGVVCSNDFTAAQLMRTFEVLGVRVPMQIKMAAFDDVKYANLLPVPLTTIHQPCADIGAAAMRAMIDRVHDPHIPPRDIQLAFRLVTRQSTARTVRH